MPTKNPRMMLTLTPELSKAFDDFREATGTAPASFVTRLLVESIPMIQSITRATIAASRDQQEALDILQSAMGSALHQGNSVQLDMIDAGANLRRARGTKPKKANP